MFPRVFWSPQPPLVLSLMISIVFSRRCQSPKKPGSERASESGARRPVSLKAATSRLRTKAHIEDSSDATTVSPHHHAQSCSASFENERRPVFFQKSRERASSPSSSSAPPSRFPSSRLSSPRECVRVQQFATPSTRARSTAFKERARPPVSSIERKRRERRRGETALFWFKKKKQGWPPPRTTRPWT